MTKREDDNKKAWLLSGRMARLVRQLTGGQGLGIIEIEPASIQEALKIIDELRVVVDEYDAAIIEIALRRYK